MNVVGADARIGHHRQPVADAPAWMGWLRSMSSADVCATQQVFADVRISLGARCRVNRLIQREGLTQVTAAARLEVREPRVSALQSYKLEGFAAEDPMSFLRALAKPAQKCSYR